MRAAVRLSFLFLFFILALFVFSQQAYAQTEDELKSSCISGSNSVTTKVKGFSVSVYPAEEKEFVGECAAKVTSPKGRTVFETHDQGTWILTVTGRDINGDGEPEAVIGGWSGGAHCCWTYWIVSLGNSPRLLARLYNERSISFQKVEGHAGITLVTEDGRFDYFDDMCHACSPFPSVYLRFERGRLEDVSAEFWSEYQKEVEKVRERLSSTELSEFRSQWRKHQKGGLNTFEEIRGLVLNMVLGYLYGGKPEEAWKALDEMWPRNDLRRIKRLILKTRGKGFVAWAQDASNFDD